MSNTKEDKERQRQFSMIARMAGNIAGGLVAADGYETAHMNLVVRHSVDMAFAIVAEIDQRLG